METCTPHFPLCGEVALPKLPLRDGNAGPLPYNSGGFSSSETSSKGWKHGAHEAIIAPELASETSSKGWKLFEIERPVLLEVLPKLPLRDGNLKAIRATRMSGRLPKLPLRDGNIPMRFKFSAMTLSSETSSKGWKQDCSGVVVVLSAFFRNFL